MGEEHELIESIGRLSTLDGDLLSTDVRRNGNIIHTDHVTGKVWEFPDPAGKDMAAWVRRAWGIQHLESKGYEFQEADTLLDRASSIYGFTEDVPANEFHPAVTRRFEIELVRDAPLLHRHSIYDDGVLVKEMIIQQYRLPPASEFPARVP